MLQGLRTVVYHVGDLARAKAWYSDVLGRAPYFDEPFYVGFNVGGYELGLVPDGAAAGPGGAYAYWGVPSIEPAIAKLEAAGATALEPVSDVGGGIKVAAVSDPFGNTLGVIENPHFRVEPA